MVYSSHLIDITGATNDCSVHRDVFCCAIFLAQPAARATTSRTHTTAIQSCVWTEMRRHPQSWLYDMFGIPEGIELVSCLHWLKDKDVIKEANLAAMYAVFYSHDEVVRALWRAQDRLEGKR